MNDLKENDNIKRLTFFAFYLIFFVVIILLLRSSFNNNKISKLTKDNTGYKHEFNLEKLESNNYHFIYSLERNGIKTNYDGDRYNNMMLFNKSGIESSNYYINDTNFYIKNKNTLEWKNTNNPIEFYKFIDYENIDKLLVHGTYISRNDYFDEENFDYIYEITNSSILTNIDNKNGDDDSLVNTITIHVNKNIVESIDMDLSSYYNMLDKNINSYKLTFNYSKYGRIEENDVKVIK